MKHLKLYHGSRKLFDQLSNAYHYSGNGKMNAGWGGYLSSDLNMAFEFPLDMPATSMVWVADGKKLYHNKINTGYYYLESREDHLLFHTATKSTIIKTGETTC